MASETLVVIVGAGASVAAGISSTARLTETAKKAMPLVTVPGVSHGMAGSGSHRFDRFPALADILDQALRADYGSDYDFEILLNALEELEAFLGPRYNPSGFVTVNTPVLGAFAELMRRFECINDESLMREARLDILQAVHRAVGSDSDYPLNGHIAVKAREQLNRLFETLATDYRLVVIDFNYDDVLDRIPVAWQDGFTASVGGASCSLFSPDDWNGFVGDGSSHLLMHLHGSVRYGYRPSGTLTPTTRFAEPARFDTILGAQQSIVGAGVGGTTVHGSVEDASFIVSGLGKVGKLTYNARPYGYYYRTVMDFLSKTEKLLVLGYSWRDYHVNTWVNEYIDLRPNRRTAVVTLRPGTEVGNNQSLEYRALAPLVGAAWSSIETFAYARTEEEKAAHQPSRFKVDGGFAIAPEGFIMEADDESALLDFITA